MSLPEGYLPREGDVLLIRGTVRFDTVVGESVYIKVGHTSTALDLSEIIGIHSINWEVEDRVAVADSPYANGTVVAVSEGWVWIKFDAPVPDMARFGSARAEDVRRAPEKENPAKGGEEEFRLNVRNGGVR